LHTRFPELSPKAQQKGCAFGKFGALIAQPGGCAMSDRIEKTIALKASVARVWQALTDHREFGTWFRCKLDGPFVPGQAVQGHITYPGYEHLRWEAVVVQMQPQKLFSFHWHPYAVDPGADYSAELPTLVEFTLEPTATGTLLRVVESGFDKLPAERRLEAFRMNDRGWGIQMNNILEYLNA
jgi:uncharacterized protein YndB with AHSA1/START domain